MRSAPGVTEAAASLLEADPALAAALGSEATAELGHERILSVLAVPAGPWLPPERDALDGGIVAVVVLDGLLAAGTPSCLIGPGDVLEPWDRNVVWTACTPARLALLGTRFIDALQAWPGASAGVLGRAGGGTPEIAGFGAVDERMLDLLWQVAARWGVSHRNGVGLPRALGMTAMGALLGVSERRADAAFSLLAARGSVSRGDGSGWRMLPAPAGPRTGHSRQRRDDLRSRLVHQFAVSREMRSDHAELSAESHAQVTASQARRAGAG
jgi:hypothetical protein